jgi:hypothetical protein
MSWTSRSILTYPAEVAWRPYHQAMRFVLLVCDDEIQSLPASDAETQSRYEAFVACEQQMKARGGLRQPRTAATDNQSTTVRKSDRQ